MKDTILFDLDGTLLPMDFHKFMKTYFGAMGNHFKAQIDPATLIDYINKATEVTVMTNDGRTNEDIFMEHFNQSVSGKVEEFLPIWEEFYDTSFFACKETTWQSKEIIEAVELLKEKGYKLAIATNPLLPLKSNLHRINWSGLDPKDFLYISSFEQNSYCKPFLEFYTEVLEGIEVDASRCIMVGNDVSEDLVIRNLGVETYLITDCILNTKQKEIITDHQGTYVDFLEFCKHLPSVK